MLKGPAPVVEVEKKTAAAEPLTSSQDIIDKRPETDFHFFSDSEVTKYVLCNTYFYSIR